MPIALIPTATIIPSPNPVKLRIIQSNKKSVTKAEIKLPSTVITTPAIKAFLKLTLLMKIEKTKVAITKPIESVEANQPICCSVNAKLMPTTSKYTGKNNKTK